jgi:3-phosphoshikimate 1-carboxyvinyltransferase
VNSASLGARVEALPDGMRIEGVADLRWSVGSHGDHRIAMSMAVAALRAKAPVTIEDIGLHSHFFSQLLGTS